MDLRIREVTTENWRSVVALSVTEQQNQFIESNAFSLAESKFEENGISVGLYDGKTLVGYAMYGFYSQQTESAWLDRFMIDFHFQGNGYAKRFMPLLIKHIQSTYGCKKIYLSVHPDNHQAIKLYEAFEFRLTGDIDDSGPVTGVVMELILK